LTLARETAITRPTGPCHIEKLFWTRLFMDLTTSTILIACAALMLGGFAKGMLGVGLPMVATPIISTFAPIPEVIAVMYFPLLTANAYQAITGGHLTVTFRRFWPMLFTIAILVPVGTYSLVRFSAGTVAVILGIAVAVFALASLVKPTLHIPQRLERPFSLVAGAVGGYFAGMVLIGGPAVVILMVALRLKKEEFVGTVGLVYLFLLIPAGLSLTSMGVIRSEHIIPGLLALVPVGAALLVGKWLRGKFDQEKFHTILLVSMVLIGLNLIRRGIF
jgi:uncharacterized membrane protein YfcA